MADDRKNIKVDEHVFGLLKASKPHGQNWGEFLVHALRFSTPHEPTVRERDNPLNNQIMCEKCGRTAHNLRDLDQNLCKVTEEE